MGELTKDECALNVNMMTSADVQKLRDELDRRAGGLPAVVCSPFLGLMQVHVDAEGRPAAVALVNLRISEQGPVRVKVRGLPSDVRSVTWQALCRAPETLPVERTEDTAFVTVPEIGAWNAGYLDLTPTEAVQARMMRDNYRLWFSWPSVDRITYWNLVDHTYHKENLASGLYTADMRKKRAYRALDRLINREWKTRADVKVRADGVLSFRGFRGRYRLSWTGEDGEAASKVVEVK